MSDAAGATRPDTMRHEELCLVIPCYNEANRLPVDELVAYVGATGASLLLVDDGSSDRTGERLRTVRARAAGRAHVLTLPTNRGKAEAVRLGVEAAFERGHSVVGYWDADLATPLSAVDDLLAAFRPTTVMVSGARIQLLGREIVRSTLRHYLGRIFATAASFVVGLPVYDTQCGAKLFRNVPVVRDAFSRPFLSSWYFDVEIYARVKAGFGQAALPHGAIVERPLEAWRDVRDSRLRARDAVRAPIDLIRIRFSERGKRLAGLPRQPGSRRGSAFPDG